MPALRLLHRRWGIASDDVILAIPPLLFHLAWVITLPVRAMLLHPFMWKMSLDSMLIKAANMSFWAACFLRLGVVWL